MHRIYADSRKYMYSRIREYGPKPPHSHAAMAGDLLFLEACTTMMIC